MNELEIVESLIVSSDLVIIPYLFSLLGSVSFIVSLIVFMFLIGKENEALLFFIGSLITGGTVYLIKFLIKRPRPYVVGKGMEVLFKTGGHSFPSGHSAFAFLFVTILSDFYEKGKYLYILAALVAVSRVFLGVHYPTDIIAGSLLGYGIGKLVTGSKEFLIPLKQRQ